MSDLISRQAAIDAIMCEPTDAHYPSWYAERLEQLPSAQPDSKETSSTHKALDTVSRQAAIDAIGNYLKKDGDQIVIADVVDAAVAIGRLPSAQPEQRWIPCSERLPEERGFYLTTTKDKAVYCDYWNEDNFDRTEMVIAWMPLPEPYREERTEE